MSADKGAWLPEQVRLYRTQFGERAGDVGAQFTWINRRRIEPAREAVVDVKHL